MAFCALCGGGIVLRLYAVYITTQSTQKNNIRAKQSEVPDYSAYTYLLLLLNNANK